MLNINPLAVMAAAAALLPSALATFDASANTNMAVYWGQGPNQEPLEVFCDDDKIDIIQIGFVNVFPDQSGGYPGTNFGNQCGSETYDNINGSSSLLLSHCPGVGSNITYCQSIGKKVLLSLGGAIPNNQHLDSDVTAAGFATFLWEAFGPENSSKTTPRPFGNAVVDGFDFDIESVLVSGEDAGDLDRGYGTMVDTLRTLYDTDKSKTYYVSAAPQCIVPDAHLADAIETSPFDFLFVQFYNTPQCSARAYFDHSYGGTNSNISFSSWVGFVQGHSFNPNTKVYLGLPAAPNTSVVYDPKMYLQPEEANEIIKALQCEYEHEFGGVMVYEATFSQNNEIHGQSYADVLKGYLENTGCTVSVPVTSSATVHSSRAISSTHVVSTVHAVSTTPTTSSVHIASSSAVISPTHIASSVSVPRSSSSAVNSSISISPGETSARISTSGISLPAVPSGSSTTTSSGEVVVSMTEVSSSGLPPSGSPSSGLYQNATFKTGSFASTSVVTLSTPTPILPGTTITSVPESTEYTSLTTYTTVTSCPVTITEVQSGSTSIIVETSLITSTITTCPRCSEKTKSASVPDFSSSTPGSPGEVGTTVPVPVPSSSSSLSPSGVPQSSPSVAPADQSSGPLPSPTTYTITKIVSTLTTTCSEATTFSLSSSGRVYTATVNETLTIADCPCTLTQKTVGYSVPTGAGPPPGRVPLAGSNSAAANFLVGTSYFGNPGSPGAENTPSSSGADESNNSPHAGSSSFSGESKSSNEGSIGSSGGESTGAPKAVSQSNSNGESGTSSPSAGSPGISNAASQGNSFSESGASSPGPGNKAGVPQPSSSEQSNAQGSPSEAEAAGSASKAVAQALASGVAGAHIPVVTMELIPAPENPSHSAQSGKVNQHGQQSGQQSGQQNGQQSGQQSAEQNGQQSAEQKGQQGGQQSGQNEQQIGQQSGQSGQQNGQQSGQQGSSVPFPVNNGTAPASPSGTAPVSQGTGSGSPAISFPKEFKGTASRVGGRLFGVIAAVVMISLF